MLYSQDVPYPIPHTKYVLFLAALSLHSSPCTTQLLWDTTQFSLLSGVLLMLPNCIQEPDKDQNLAGGGTNGSAQTHSGNGWLLSTSPLHCSVMPIPLKLSFWSSPAQSTFKYKPFSPSKVLPWSLCTASSSSPKTFLLWVCHHADTLISPASCPFLTHPTYHPAKHVKENLQEVNIHNNNENTCC